MALKIVWQIYRDFMNIPIPDNININKELHPNLDVLYNSIISRGLNLNPDESSDYITVLRKILIILNEEKEFLNGHYHKLLLEEFKTGNLEKFNNLLLEKIQDIESIDLMIYLIDKLQVIKKNSPRFTPIQKPRSKTSSPTSKSTSFEPEPKSKSKSKPKSKLRSKSSSPTST
jgi:hypothetical protein